MMRMKSDGSDERKRGAMTRLTATLIAATLCLALVPTGAAAAPDPERHDDTPIGWGWYPHAPAGVVTDFIEDHNMRLIDLEVTSPTRSKFAAAMVHNSGPFARKWWWYYGKTLPQMKELVKGRRLIDLESYKRNGKRRYAATMVKNTGVAGKKWWWYVNVKPAFIKNAINNKKARIIDIDKHSSGRYDVILVKNKGEDAKAWWYYYRLTVASVKNKLKKHNGRLVDIERDGDGRYTVVMNKSKGKYWWWHDSLTSKQVTELHQQIGMRIYDIERYRKKFWEKPRYAVLLLNDLDAAGTAARQAMWKEAGNVPFGFYLKQVDGPVLQWILADKVFEPASMLKALYHITAMLAVKDGDASVAEVIPWYVKPDDPNTDDVDESMSAGICAYADNGTPITTNATRDAMSLVLSGMMKQSDNRMTDAIYNRFGRDAINNMATELGMSKTMLNHRIGCTWEAAEVKASNELTLQDHGRIFEAVARIGDPILGTGTVRDQFYDYMGSGVSAFETVVSEEAASLGKSTEVAEAFYGAMKGAFKPGGYRNSAGGCDGTTCKKALMRSTGGGWIALPHSAERALVYKDFVYGAFFDGVFKCAPGKGGDFCTEYDKTLKDARAKAYAEMLRPHIKAALMTW